MKNRFKKNFVVCYITFAVILVFVATIFIFNNSNIFKIKKDENITYEKKAKENKTFELALLSKPLGSSTFSEITATPTTGYWTITSTCSGMSVTWNNDNYTLDYIITSTPAHCKVSFTQLNG